MFLRLRLRLCLRNTVELLNPDSLTRTGSRSGGWSVERKVADHFRKLNQQPAGQGGTDANQRMSIVADLLGDDDEEEAGEDHALLVQRAMDMIKSEFSEQNWAAFLRVVTEGCSAVEVAEAINVNAQVVRQANYRIRRRLRLVLQDLIE